MRLIVGVVAGLLVLALVIAIALVLAAPDEPTPPSAADETPAAVDDGRGDRRAVAEHLASRRPPSRPREEIVADLTANCAPHGESTRRCFLAADRVADVQACTGSARDRALVLRRESLTPMPTAEEAACSRPGRPPRRSTSEPSGPSLRGEPLRVRASRGKLPSSSPFLSPKLWGPKRIHDRCDIFAEGH